MEGTTVAVTDPFASSDGSFPSRRDLRATGRPEPRARRTDRAAPRPDRQAGTHRSAAVVVRRSKRRTVLSAVVMVFAAGLIATIALPSYTLTKANAATAHTKLLNTQSQNIGSNGAKLAVPTRDAFSATSAAELKRKQLAKAYAAYTGPTAAQYLSNPAHPSFSLSAVYETALKYRGVPYVFGGADPSGFDCSGFVMFVYAQFGISLPHSVHLQDGIGTQISESAAQPGDIVVFNDDSHDGFYAGNGEILHAPYAGASVRVQPLWSSDVHYIRFGI